MEFFQVKTSFPSNMLADVDRVLFSDTGNLFHYRMTDVAGSVENTINACAGRNWLTLITRAIHVLTIVPMLKMVTMGLQTLEE
jgi:hypothetical protein